MVNTINLYRPLLQATLRLAGVRPQKLEIESGTIMNFWVPTQTKNKPPIVFLHGFVGDGILTWQFQVVALARKYAVYVPDLLFFGGSITGSNRRSVDFQAECVAKGLAKLGVLRGCTLVGFSYGGFVAFKLAELNRELVSSLVVTGATDVMTESISKECLEKMGHATWQALLLPNSGSGFKRMFEIGSYKLGSTIPLRLLDDGFQVLFGHRKERVKLLEALVVPDQDSAFPSLSQSQRVHLLWGEHDGVTGVELAKKLQERLGDKATLECIEKAGHTAPLDRPFVYAERLAAILASSSSSGRGHPN